MVRGRSARRRSSEPSLAPTPTSSPCRRPAATAFSWVAAQLERNVGEALAFFRAFGEPRLAVGDMNATPDSAPLDNLRENGWIDLWARLRPEESGFTFESDRP